MSSSVTPDDVLSFSAPTEGFLCELSDNTYGIEFQEFVIKDYESKRVLFQVGGEDVGEAKELEDVPVFESSDDLRTIKYTFNVDVLRLPTVSTKLKFSVGGKPLEGFRMIERHYFRDALVKSFDFAFGFVPPNTCNEWEAVYDLKKGLDADLVEAMVAAPYETRSDSFYFVNDQLIMQNKAYYAYVVDETTTSMARADTSADDESKM